MYKVSLHALACFINKDTHSNGHSQKDIKNYGTLPISGASAKFPIMVLVAVMMN